MNALIGTETPTDIETIIAQWVSEKNINSFIITVNATSRRDLLASTSAMRTRLNTDDYLSRGIHNIDPLLNAALRKDGPVTIRMADIKDKVPAYYDYVSQSAPTGAGVCFRLHSAKNLLSAGSFFLMTQTLSPILSQSRQCCYLLRPLIALSL